MRKGVVSCSGARCTCAAPPSSGGATLGPKGMHAASTRPTISACLATYAPARALLLLLLLEFIDRRPRSTTHDRQHRRRLSAQCDSGVRLSSLYLPPSRESRQSVCGAHLLVSAPDDVAAVRISRGLAADPERPEASTRVAQSPRPSGTQSPVHPAQTQARRSDTAHPCSS